MNHTPRLVILGGDRRMDAVCDELAKGTGNVRFFPFAVPEMEEELKCADVLVLPMPASMGAEQVNGAKENPISWARVVSCLREDMLLIGGMLPKCWVADAVTRGVRVVDLTNSDRLAWKNALPTAEGALAIAMECMPMTLMDAKTVLIGYGRIASLLLPRLLALGSHVCVVARREEARKQAQEAGAETMEPTSLCDAVRNADLIVNTVPSVLLNKAVLEACPKRVLIIDLASKPGGVDFDIAEKLGLKTVWALGLPGKVAPISAGIYLAQEIQMILREEGMTCSDLQ